MCEDGFNRDKIKGRGKLGNCYNSKLKINKDLNQDVFNRYGDEGINLKVNQKEKLLGFGDCLDMCERGIYGV